MPYISKKRRSALWHESTDDLISAIATKGELNYLITNLMIEYIQKHGISYMIISDAIAAAQDAADEMKRRILSRYENRMIKKNGDVYQDILKLF